MLIAPPPKKFRMRLNVSGAAVTYWLWERNISSTEAVSGASAHPPLRPYGLTRPVVPPGGSPLFSRTSRCFSHHRAHRLSRSATFAHRGVI
jgi:hypothetical protein